MIDWDRVRELRSEIGAEDFGEVVALFLEEADEVIAKITDAAGAKVLEADLHSLKGAALNLGFAEFAALCQSCERLAATGSTDVELNRVRQSYSASKRRFEDGLDQACAA